MNREKIKKWTKEKKEVWIFLRLVILGLVIFWAISWAVFYYLGLELCDLREIGGSQETGVTNKDKLIERAFTIIGGIVGGIIAVIGLSALTWRLILMGKQTKSSQEQVEISQKSQYTEQFLKSVEQTASDKLEICLGGLASLDALSRENKEEYRRVWEYLGDFLRHHKPLKDEGEKPHPKVNAIVQMLRERKRKRYEDFVLDLSYAHLEGVDLSYANLSKAYFFGAHLDRAHFFRAHLDGTHLVEANLVRASLEEASLVGAILIGSSLWGANLSKASLVGANLCGAFLVEANLSEADLVGANLERALFGGRIKSGEVQDLTALKSEQIRGTYYEKNGCPPKLPAGISDKDKPKAISAKDWGEL